MALSVTVLCFLAASDARQAMRETARVLKPGGCLILGKLSPYSLWALRRRLRGWLGASLWCRAAFGAPTPYRSWCMKPACM